MKKERNAVLQQLLRDVPGLILASELLLSEPERHRRRFRVVHGGAAGDGFMNDNI